MHLPTRGPEKLLFPPLWRRRKRRKRRDLRPRDSETYMPPPLGLMRLSTRKATGIRFLFLSQLYL
jgi:hypothetical protein